VKSRTVVLFLTVAAVLLLSAFPAQATSIAKLKQQVAALEGAPKFPFTVPLSHKPAKNVSVYFLEGSLLNEEPQNAPFTAATNALGWKLTVLQYDSTNPQGADGAMEEAAAAKANFIIIGGQTTSSLAAGLAATKAAKIPVIFEDTQAPETGIKGDGVSLVVQNNQLALVSMKALIDIAAVKYNGKAHMLFTTDSEIPSLLPLTPLLQKYAKSACSTCTFQVQALSGAEVATGNVGPNIISTLQTNPKIDYVICLFTAVCADLAPSLQTAGLTGKVQISVLAPDQTFSDEVLQGTVSAAILMAYGETPWAIIDACARMSEGQAFNKNLYGLLPLTVSTKSINPPPATGYYEGPPGYQQKFEKLWHVG
jgi:ABC-type sugar transport system substrate-binding protein